MFSYSLILILAFISPAESSPVVTGSPAPVPSTTQVVSPEVSSESNTMEPAESKPESKQERGIKLDSRSTHSSHGEHSGQPVGHHSGDEGCKHCQKHKLKHSGQPVGHHSGDKGCKHCQKHKLKHSGHKGCKNCQKHKFKHSGHPSGQQSGRKGCKHCQPHKFKHSGQPSGRRGCKHCSPHSGKHPYRHGGLGASYRRPGWGGFGYTTVGILHGDWGGYRDAITHPSGTPLDRAKAAYLVGGGGAMLLGGRYVIGGKGFGLFSPLVEADWGKAALTGGGGGLDVGVVLINSHRWLVYPKAGLGGQGHTLTIRNSSNADLRFGSGGSLVAASSDEKFTTGFFTADIGIGFQRLMFSRKTGGGLISGGEVGVMMSLSEGAWTDDNDGTVRGAPPLRMIALYLRLNLGGGGFTFSEFGGK